MHKFKDFPITYTLMIINIFIFLIPTAMQSWYIPIHQEGSLTAFYVILYDEGYRFISSMFIHNGAMHIVMNMLSVYMLGIVVERIFKPSAYLGIYFMSGIFGSFLYMYINPNGWAAGASGAIFGIFGALAGFAWLHRNTMREQFLAFMRSFGVVILLNLFIGVVFDSIAMSAHVGGLIAGLIGGVIIGKNPKYLWIYLITSLVLFALLYYLFPVAEIHVQNIQN